MSLVIVDIVSLGQNDIMLPCTLLFYVKLVCVFVWFLNVLVNKQAISRTGPKTELLTILRAATHETELGDHDFCLSNVTRECMCVISNGNKKMYDFQFLLYLCLHIISVP